MICEVFFLSRARIKTSILDSTNLIASFDPIFPSPKKRIWIFLLFKIFFLKFSIIK